MSFVTYKVDDRQYSAQEVIDILNSNTKLFKSSVHGKVSKNYLSAAITETLGPPLSPIIALVLMDGLIITPLYLNYKYNPPGKRIKRYLEENADKLTDVQKVEYSIIQNAKHEGGFFGGLAGLLAGTIVGICGALIMLAPILLGYAINSMATPKSLNDWEISLKDSNDSYSGSELVYLLNAYANSKNNKQSFQEAIKKFIAHDIPMSEVAYIDDAGWFKGPSAVLNCHKPQDQEENIAGLDFEYTEI